MTGDATVRDAHGRPLDQIRLTGITATGYHGVFEHERREGQTFVADVVVHLDTRRAAAHDDLAHTLDYGTVASQVAAVLAGEPADLVETVAERIAATVLASGVVEAVDVAVHKPQAPIAVPFDDVVVAIRRDRSKLPAAEPLASAPVHASSSAQASSAYASPSAEGAAVPPSEPAGHASPSVPTAGLSAVAADRPAGSVPDVLDEPPGVPVPVVLALGSNLGASEATLREAVRDLAAVDGLDVDVVSPLARTVPVGGPEQGDYLNAVVLATTTLAPRALLHATQDVEAAHGRERTVHWGPRTLDVDIVVYGSVTAVADDLELPHPRAHERAFVLEPWSQVDPHAVLPGLGGGPVAALAATAPDREGVRWLALDWLDRPAAPPVAGSASSAGRHAQGGESATAVGSDAEHDGTASASGPAGEGETAPAAVGAQGEGTPSASGVWMDEDEPAPVVYGSHAADDEPAPTLYGSQAEGEPTRAADGLCDEDEPAAAVEPAAPREDGLAWLDEPEPLPDRTVGWPRRPDAGS